ncbi:unnamed protein product [Soboliphyme baturini]|uniref:Fucosyltransferase n=1 Tax=Soboliphyme baturini TaxID=241478 RepID=A0A183J1G5_9BILA|nr:unnamed protein product [Soboliphyme baturini]
MGAPKEDYERIAPPHSFVHVEDFASPRQLAEYLLKLDKNDTLYNSYFQWKSKGEFINTRFWCRVCALLNEPKSKYYPDVDKWWRSPGICRTGRWSAE